MAIYRLSCFMRFLRWFFNIDYRQGDLSSADSTLEHCLPPGLKPIIIYTFIYITKVIFRKYKTRGTGALTICLCNAIHQVALMFSECAPALYDLEFSLW